VNNGTGIGVVEAYDLDHMVDSLSRIVVAAISLAASAVIAATVMARRG
jgi:hypothetical protein